MRRIEADRAECIPPCHSATAEGMHVKTNGGSKRGGNGTRDDQHWDTDW